MSLDELYREYRSLINNPPYSNNEGTYIGYAARLNSLATIIAAKEVQGKMKYQWSFGDEMPLARLDNNATE